MTRALPVCAVLLALPLFGPAQEQAAPTETVIRMTVQPAAEPKPALRYQLLPELREMKPGNPLLAYLKCFMEQNNFFYSKEAEENREKWNAMPLKDLPLKKLRSAGYGTGTGRLSDADYAARLDSLDWQITQQLRSEGMYLLLPELQPLRILAAALRVRFRAEVAERRFDDALVTAKTMLALARHLGEHPTLIGDLVGIAMATMAFGPLDEMIPQPGCPNLYWALTDLPDPLIGLRQGLQGERLFLSKEFAALDEQRSMTEAQLHDFMDLIANLMRGMTMEYGLAQPGVPTQQQVTPAPQKDHTRVPARQEKPNAKLPSPQRDPRGWLTARAKDEGHVRAARQRLVAHGLPSKRVQQFPPFQVVLLDDKLTFEVQRDEATKALMLPYWQAAKTIAAGQPTKASGMESLFGSLVPAVTKVRLAQARIQQRIGLLRCVEALRMYAAEHEGRLPARLDEVNVPVPVDPVTGRPFLYTLDGTTATVRGTPPAGLEKNAAYNVRYEITIAR